jgi:hypothetical protein
MTVWPSHQFAALGINVGELVSEQTVPSGMNKSGATSEDHHNGGRFVS